MTITENPPEGKADASRRIRREGRWEAASAFKDKVVTKLRKDGMKRAESNVEGWKRMIAEYPPLPMADKQKPNQSDDKPASQAETIDQRVLSNLPDSTVDDFQLDVLWVLDHLAHPGPDFTGAPSKASVGLYFWAKRSPDKFMDRFCKLIQQQKPAAGSHQRSEPGANDELIEEIESLLGMSDKDE